MDVTGALERGPLRLPRGRVPIVGVGLAPRAGTVALEECLALLWQLPSSAGRAVVVASSEVEALERGTGTPVVPALDGTALEPGRTYVTSPDGVATVEGDVLRVRPRAATRAPGHPIDHLFRSLARRNAAVAVLLSGASGDGTLGAREIRHAGGLAFGTGKVADVLEGGLATDVVLTADDIGRRLRDLPVGDAPVRPRDLERLTGVFFLLREATGTDFSRVRLRTTLERVRRRLHLSGEPDLDAYVERLARDPDELHALHRDLARRATPFFRDEAALDHLRAVVAERLRARDPDPVRIWVPACGTGEAAYSVAIAVAEVMEACGGEVPVKVLATDHDGRLLEGARAGVYPGGIAMDVSSERLDRFFVAAHEDHYRINSRVRDLCTFGRHDLVDDPPFSNLDLVWCPDVLGELDPVSVGRLLPRFHYALKEGGRAILGAAPPGALELFTPDGAAGVYARRPGPRAGWVDRSTSSRPPARGGTRADLRRETDAAILRRYAPPGVVVDAEWNVLWCRGPVAPYVEVRSAQPRQNLAHLARPELLPEIRRLVDVSAATGRPARSVPIRVRRTHGSGVVEIDVLPITCDGTRCWLVTFEEIVGRSIAAQDADAVRVLEVARLQRELELLRDTLGAALREREEELEAAREEIRSLGEQYHATYEGLAHAKRELAASADELHRRSSETWTAQSELQALVRAVDVPLVTVGPDLRVRWSTPSAEELFRVRQADVGRPIAELRQALDLDDLDGRLRAVIATGASQRAEARDGAGRRFAIVTRALVGREGAVDGAVVFALDLGGS